MNNIKYIFLGTIFLLCFFFITENLNAYQFNQEPYLLAQQLLRIPGGPRSCRSRPHPKLRIPTNRFNFVMVKYKNLTKRTCLSGSKKQQLKQLRKARAELKKIHKQIQKTKKCPWGSKKTTIKKGRKKEIRCLPEEEDFDDEKILFQVVDKDGRVKMRYCGVNDTKIQTPFTAQESVGDSRCYRDRLEKLGKEIDQQFNEIRADVLPKIREKLGVDLYEKLALSVGANDHRKMAERFIQAGFKPPLGDSLELDIIGIDSEREFEEISASDLYQRLRTLFREKGVKNLKFSNYSNPEYFEELEIMMD